MNSPHAAGGSQEAGFTQPRAHSFAQPCTVFGFKVKRVRLRATQTAGAKTCGKRNKNATFFTQPRFYHLAEYFTLSLRKCLEGLWVPASLAPQAARAGTRNPYKSFLRHKVEYHMVQMFILAVFLCKNLVRRCNGRKRMFASSILPSPILAHKSNVFSESTYSTIDEAAPRPYIPSYSVGS